MIVKVRNMSGSTQMISSRPTIKVILVGDTGVGKTCLISAFFKQPFDFESIATVAPAYSCADVTRCDNVDVCLQIWDTAGSERYHSVSRLFFRDCDVALLCCHAKEVRTVKSIDDWVRMVHEEAPEAKICLVLTKVDLYPDYQADLIKLDGERLAREHNLQRSFVTSAKCNIGVNEVFQAASEMCSPAKVIRTKTVAPAPSRSGSKFCC